MTNTTESTEYPDYLLKQWLRLWGSNQYPSMSLVSKKTIEYLEGSHTYELPMEAIDGVKERLDRIERKLQRDEA